MRSKGWWNASKYRYLLQRYAYEFFIIEGEGRSRTYDDRTPDRLVEIGKLYKEGLSRQQVNEALGKLPPP